MDRDEGKRVYYFERPENYRGGALQCLYLYRKPLLVNLFCLLFLILYSTLGGFVFLHFEKPYSQHLKALELRSKTKCIVAQMQVYPPQRHQQDVNESSVHHAPRSRRTMNIVEYAPYYPAAHQPSSTTGSETMPLVAERITQHCVMEEKYDERVEWNLKNSALFGFGILTTLGYGKIEPQTTNGRLFTVIYGFIGVPFTVIIFTNFGRYIQNLERAIRRRLCGAAKRADGDERSSTGSGGWRRGSSVSKTASGRRKSSLFRRGLGVSLLEPWRRGSMVSVSLSGSHHGDDADTDDDEAPDQISPVTLVGIVIFYLLLGAVLMPHLNAGEIDFFNGIYFAFLCLTAIEYGKLIPTNSAYLPIVILYICLGLAISTIALDIGSTYVRRLYFVGRKIRNISNVKIWFGAKHLRVRELLAALGHNIGLEPTVLCDIDLEQLVQNAIQVKEGRMVRVPQTHMIMDGIWPPELVPLFLKDGGQFPTYVDADEPKRPSVVGRAGMAEFRTRLRKWSTGPFGSFRRRPSGGLRRSASVLSTGSFNTPPEKPPPLPPMREGHHKLSVRFEDLIYSHSLRQPIINEPIPELDDTTSGIDISVGSASLLNFPPPPPLPNEVPPPMPLSTPPASTGSSSNESPRYMWARKNGMAGQNFPSRSPTY